MRTLIMVLGLVVILVPVVPTLPAQSSWQEAVEQWRGECQKAGVVGASVLLQDGGRTIFHGVHGHADLASGRKVDRDTIFHWASITKTLTGVAILQLRDRGQLKLDDPIVRWVPELREAHDPRGEIEKITLRHLLSHSAGFRGPTWPWGGSKPWHPHEPTRWSQLVAMMPYTEVAFPPGSRFSYSNPGIIFLGRVIEEITGDEWEVYIEKNIFRPLGMTRSYFDRTPWHLLPHRSNNYRMTGGKPVAQGLDFDTGITVSNGGWNAPLGDLARWTAFLAGHVEGVGAGVLSRESLREMWQPQQKTGRSSGPGSGRTRSMGLTFFVDREADGRLLVSHTGGQKAFVTVFVVDPASGRAALAAFNTAGQMRPGTGTIMARLRTALEKTWFAAGEAPKRDVASALPSAWHGNWHGTMVNTKAKGEPTEVPVTFRVEPIPGTEALSWTMSYGAGPERLVKDYRLVAAEEPGRFVIDEGDGTLLPLRLVGSVLHGQFAVGQRSFNARYALGGDVLSFEVTMAEPATKDDEGKTVKPRRVDTVQSMRLERR